MISYLLANKKTGNITDPEALRLFWTRVYHDKVKTTKISTRKHDSDQAHRLPERTA